jgi:hyaluronate lyase
MERDGELRVAAADPTQANTGGLRIAIDRAAAEVLAKDESVEVLQTTPTLVLQIDTNGSRGRTHRIRLKLATEPKPAE